MTINSSFSSVSMTNNSILFNAMQQPMFKDLQEGKIGKNQQKREPKLTQTINV